ncbi:hypothetical protein BU23DRAFT_598821 [Bimuria novae-zelandiae CBS 107.79]|uniref:Uncharacterized protein n=1 Tax=Bimuria novae-zelandiae CBS 107.79 TaxID=1447943 RepID=A0A6A5VF78_9PLEO|nr:hypothetical protein BU23DRAFT_598821 [Bimuria novae-zelandiae CBS 107.79]
MKRYPSRKVSSLPALKKKKDARTRGLCRWFPKRVYGFALVFVMVVLAVTSLLAVAPRVGEPHFPRPRLTCTYGKAWCAGGSLRVKRCEWVSTQLQGSTQTANSALRVASVYLKDGRSVDVARVEGSTQYAHVLQTHPPFPGPPTTKNTALCRAVVPTARNLERVLSIQVPVPQHCLSADVQAVKAVLESLKRGVEAHLGQEICHVSLLVDGEPAHAGSSRHQDAVVLQALHATGVAHIPLGSPDLGRGAIHPVLRAYLRPLEGLGLPVSSSGEEARNMLAVDTPEQQVQSIEEALHELRAAPLDADADTSGDYNWDEMDIHHVLVHGAHAAHPALLPALNHILGKDLEPNLLIDTSPCSAARWAPEAAFYKMDEWQFAVRDNGMWASYGTRCGI